MLGKFVMMTQCGRVKEVFFLIQICIDFHKCKELFFSKAIRSFELSCILSSV